MPSIKVKHNQTLFDIAMQEYGDVSGVFWLVEDNQLKGILDNLEIGQELLVREEAINIRMREYLRPHTIATGEDARGSGIGWWRITDGTKRNDTFIIS